MSTGPMQNLPSISIYQLPSSIPLSHGQRLVWSISLEASDCKDRFEVRFSFPNNQTAPGRDSTADSQWQCRCRCRCRCRCQNQSEDVALHFPKHENPDSSKRERDVDGDVKMTGIVDRRDNNTLESALDEIMQEAR
ncbi:hypothetical protein AJ78_07462 [Emergomyces pasteurianus Ep9510]|uniref:Uncharacterized protein n=1 Tax=Emergomyces pasteurianus Ep9510 TaxID=1447872 RepID=A0A1J9P566_9EURO|nr:hypothetical protein AJ78_07462 [Emergomyces pasteurianus Ep9510]